MAPSRSCISTSRENAEDSLLNSIVLRNLKSNTILHNSIYSYRRAYTTSSTPVSEVLEDVQPSSGPQHVGGYTLDFSSSKQQNRHLFNSRTAILSLGRRAKNFQLL